MTKPRRLWIALAFAATSIPATAGELIVAKGTTLRAEVVTFDAGLVPALLKTAAGGTVRVADWPVAPDTRAAVILQRREIYAPDAKVFVVDGRGQHEIPRSRLVFFFGTAEDGSELSVFAAVDPDTGSVDGFSQTREALHELHPLSEVPSRYLVAPPEFFQAERGESPTFTCGQDGAPLPFLEDKDEMRRMAEAADSIFAPAISTLHTGTIAVDTDNEFMSLKFGDNTTTATNFIASLIAAVSVVYERDTLVRLYQGTTFLRVSTTPDPYVQVGSDSAGRLAKLEEVSNVWNTTYAGVTRTVVAMLSGKETSGGASGIAWITASLCSKYYGTSFNQLFVSGTTLSSFETHVLAHEIGHNFGSPHTHCYTTPIDNCYNAQSGCYSGATSCPAAQTINGVPNVKGTLMSYCHIPASSGGVNGCTATSVFHPRTITEKVAPIVQAATQGASACIFPYVDPAPTITAVSPAGGSTAGGTPVSITGTNFQSGATVTVGGIAATSVVFVSSTRITAVTPAHAAGNVPVTVTNPTALAGTLNPGFFYATPPAATDFYTLTPCRVIDTRLANGPLGGPALAAGQTRTFTVTGTCGIPAGATSIAVNVTTVNPAAAGNLQIFPGNAFPLGTSAISFPAGSTRANNGLVTLATNGAGTFGVKNGAAGIVDFVLDVVGYNL
jgi:hypothetical protein